MSIRRAEQANRTGSIAILYLFINEAINMYLYYKVEMQSTDIVTKISNQAHRESISL